MFYIVYIKQYTAIVVNVFYANKSKWWGTFWKSVALKLPVILFAGESYC